MNQFSQRDRSPSALMRNRRPDCFSDSRYKTSYILDQATFEYHLETITSRNQTHEFEIFCRKLCERVICPNLRPATGPEGGGDSKVDTESVPVSTEIATLTFVGNSNAAEEKWAFAFSAKKKWKDKVRSDVIGIAETQRNYSRIYCVTAQFARAKDRAALEDELTKKYGIPIVIHDRSWIVEQIIECDRKDIAFNYLGVGQNVNDSRRLGPTDYSRVQELEDIEFSLSNSDAYIGMEMQRVIEALVAAKLSRNLERPRTDTDGRFARAVRLAEKDGTCRQRLEAHYEWLITSFWWFDDIHHFNSSYDAFELLVIDTPHAKNIEYLCNIIQLLFICVIQGHLTAEEAKLDLRTAKLTERLQLMVEETNRPNNALEAKVSLLLIRVNQTTLEGSRNDLSSIWIRLSEVVKQVKGLVEFNLERLVELINVLGNIADNDPAYAKLVDDIAGLVSERTGEGQGALILLGRAQQLTFDHKFEMIRLLGRAVQKLAKKEYAESLAQAHNLLALAYQSAGLFWAARASCILAIGTICIEADENNDVPAVNIVPLLSQLGGITLSLNHIPDALESIAFIRRCQSSLPLDEETLNRSMSRVETFDEIFGSQILSYSDEELKHISRFPDILESLGMYHSRSALLYVLGYEKILREDGSIPISETPEQVNEFFNMFASMPFVESLLGRPIFNELNGQRFITKVQGVRISINHDSTEVFILAAEAVVGAIEALFATTLEFEAVAHTESFDIDIVPNHEISLPEFDIHKAEMSAVLQWPVTLVPATYKHQTGVQRILVNLAISVFNTVCYVKNLDQVITQLVNDEGLIERVAIIISSGNVHQRLFTKKVSRLNDLIDAEAATFPFQSNRPEIVRYKMEACVDDAKKCKEPSNQQIRSSDHRLLDVHSIINVYL
jgi:hypothetical protein